MIKKNDIRLIGILSIIIILAYFNLMFLNTRFIHMIFVAFTSTALLISISIGDKGWIRPYSLLILSFLVFVWMRYILDLFFEIDIISVGNKITHQNTNLVAVYLGVSVAIICISAIITENIICFNNNIINGILKSRKQIIVSKFVQMMLIFGATLFFSAFLIDSVRKISIIKNNNYFSINETVLIQGYRYFTLGKYCILLWLFSSKDKNRFFIGSTFLLVASMGYLMRGARGYTVMYILMWVVFYSLRHKIKLKFVIVTGLSIIYMANTVLSYRMGRTIATGLFNIILSVLNSQGSSVEQVFGSVIFRKEIAKEFNAINLFVNIDNTPGYGVIVDRVRETGFLYGGFGSSFFGEAYFLGIPLCILFMIIAGILCGVLERAYQIARIQGYKAPYAQMALFMTTPNLVYIGRSTIKDFIVKTIVSLIIFTFFQYVAGNGRNFTFNEIKA